MLITLVSTLKKTRKGKPNEIKNEQRKEIIMVRSEINETE